MKGSDSELQILDSKRWDLWQCHGLCLIHEPPIDDTLPSICISLSTEKGIARDFRIKEVSNKLQEDSKTQSLIYSHRSDSLHIPSLLFHVIPPLLIVDLLVSFLEPAPRRLNQMNLLHVNLLGILSGTHTSLSTTRYIDFLGEGKETNGSRDVLHRSKPTVD